MALASLDVWLRMLGASGAWRRIRPRYWPRLAVGLFTSAVGTVLTLPERAALWPFLRRSWRRERSLKDGSAAGSDRGPVLLFVLGYYRSGTTHLHYLLSADPKSVTPRWYQAIAPAGFLASWTVARWLLVPFLGGTRPQDDVAYGPEWPAEDDFAVNNLSACCTMPGRMVFPSAWAHYRRYHDLRDLDERERRAWRWAQWSFVKRVEWAARARSIVLRRPMPRVIVLKTPAHTARVGELTALFGGERVRFVHLSREPGAVVRSNVAMHGRFGPFLLEDPPEESEVRARIVEEYDRTERLFLEDASALERGSDRRGGGAAVISRVRYQDLIARPIDELRRVYGELGLDWTRDGERRIAGYRREVAGYRTAADRARSSTGGRSDDVPDRLAWMHAAFAHDRPTARSDGPIGNPSTEGAAVAAAGRSGLLPEPVDGAVSAALAAGVCGAAWLGASTVAWDRMDWLVWPAGVVIGSFAVRGLAAGTRTLGVLAAVLTVMVMVLVAFPATAMTGDYRHQSPIPWDHLWTSVRRGLLAKNNLFWVFLGVVSAYRLASRRHLRAPGA